MQKVFPGGSVVKNPPANAGDEGLIPGSGRYSGEGNGYPLQYSGKSHGQRSLADYSPWGHKRVRQDLVTEQQLMQNHLPVPAQVSAQCFLVIIIYFIFNM